MPIIACPRDGCGWQTEDVDTAIAAIFIQDHLQHTHPPAARPRPPTLPQPKLAAQVSTERFAEFQREWIQFKNASGLLDAQLTSYLLNSCEASLKTDIQSAVVNVTEQTEAEVLAHMKQHAVITRDKSSLLTELLSMRQDEDETVRKFLSRVQGTARNCGLHMPCPIAGCARQNTLFVNFTDIIVKAVVLNGLAEVETRRDVLGTSGLDGKSLADTITLIQDKETAARSMALPGAQSASSGSRPKPCSPTRG